ncbi:FAD-dependent monooxygenase [Arthrobacter sp. D2-10]
MTIRVACIGGGPGGLFFSTLLKRQMPEAEVELYERNLATDAFGFGVVFSDATLNAINEADPVLRNGLNDFGKHWDTIEVRLKGQRFPFCGNGMAAIHRRTLLPLLQERAAEAGVILHFGQEAPSLLQLGARYDVIVGADGANSRTREQLSEHLGHTADSAQAKFIWFGTTHLFDGLTFIHRKSEYGNFAAHAYPINDELSTFIVETDEATWLRAGLDEFDVTQPPGRSDEKTRTFLEELFAMDIEGGEIVANNSRWGTFRTRRTTTWHHGNVVFLGDAVHTAHFSVGSGTKMAMEDAIVLAREIASQPGDLSSAFSSYQAEREPQVGKIQTAASGGLSWWEHFGRYYDAFSPSQFAFHFFSRSIGIDRILKRDPSLVEATRNEWRTEHGSEALLTPLNVGGVQFSTRQLHLEHDDDGAPIRLIDDKGTNVPIAAEPGSVQSAILLEAPGAEEGVKEVVARAPLSHAAAAIIRGGTPLTRTLVSEEVRIGLGIPAIIVDNEDEALTETLVLSGRADAVASPKMASMHEEALRG